MFVKMTVRAIAAAALMTAGATSHDITPAHASWTPCDDVTTTPRPPGPGPTPLVAGEVHDVDQVGGVAGASVKLFRCDATGPTLVATDTTDSTGTFDFGALTGPDWYYVDVVESGPLGGMVPANGTNNPSAPVEVGAGDAAMLFEFED